MTLSRSRKIIREKAILTDLPQMNRKCNLQFGEERGDFLDDHAALKTVNESRWKQGNCSGYEYITFAFVDVIHN